MRNIFKKKEKDPMDIHYYLDMIPDFDEKKKRCIYCEHIHGFRNKIPQCGAEQCIYEEDDCKED